MISVTTPTVENGVIVEYKGIVTGQVVNGVNFIKDFGASIRNIVGGRFRQGDVTGVWKEKAVLE